GVAQFLERPADDFEVAARRLVADQFVRRLLDLIDQRVLADRFKLDRRRREDFGFGKIGPRLRRRIRHVGRPPPHYDSRSYRPRNSSAGYFIAFFASFFSTASLKSILSALTRLMR